MTVFVTGDEFWYGVAYGGVYVLGLLAILVIPLLSSIKHPSIANLPLVVQNGIKKLDDIRMAETPGRENDNRVRDSLILPIEDPPSPTETAPAPKIESSIQFAPLVASSTQQFPTVKRKGRKNKNIHL